MKLLLRLMITATAVFASAYFIPGASVLNMGSALWVALFLGTVNVILRPILVILTLPINIVTLGLFTFVINASLVLLTARVIKGFEIEGFLTAVLFSILVTVVSYILNTLLGTKKK